MGNIKKYIGSIFDNHSTGASMRKILAFITGIFFTGYLHYEYVSTDNAVEFLIADLVCALLCLGIITMEQVIKFKQGVKEESETNNNTENTDDTTETTTLPPHQC
jgi:ABC-type uncharacterized transport system permease subunit